MFKKNMMARKDNIEDDYNRQEQVGEIPQPSKQLFKKDIPSEEQTQVQVVSDTELLHIKINQISAKLDEILSLAK